MNRNDRDVVDALAAYVVDEGHLEFREMNEFLIGRGVDMSGDEFLMGEHVRQSNVHEGTTLYGPVSVQYVQIVEALFKSSPVQLTIEDPASFACGEEPWGVAWVGARAFPRPAPPETGSQSGRS